jgi:hypothetical protein
MNILPFEFAMCPADGYSLSYEQFPRLAALEYEAASRMVDCV